MKNLTVKEQMKKLPVEQRVKAALLAASNASLLNVMENIKQVQEIKMENQKSEKDEISILGTWRKQ